jgi:hypothetical protein
MNYEQNEILEVVHRLMQHFELSTYSDLADKMNVGRNQPSMWIARGKFPFEIARALCDSQNLRLDWLYLGIHPKYRYETLNQGMINDLIRNLSPEQKALFKAIATNLKE